MPKEVRLLTPLSTFVRMHEAANGRKIIVPISRDYLLQILTDHTALVNACKAAGIKIVEPTPARERAKLR